MSRYCRPLYILYLPVNRLHSMLLKKLIGFTKMLATKKASVSRQRAWMRCCQYQMLWICKHRNLRLRRTPPEHIYYRSVLLIYSLYDCIRELLPAVSLMPSCSRYSQIGWYARLLASMRSALSIHFSLVSL